MILAAAVLLCLPAIDIAPTSVKRALEILDPSGSRRVSRQLEQEIVMVRADSADPVFERLAQVMQADWVRQGDGTLLLSRSAARHRELEARETAELEVEIAKELATAARILSANREPYERAKLALADLDRVREELASGRVGAIAAANGNVYEPVVRTPLRIMREEFLLALGAKAIGNLPRDHAVVWSTSPTAAQRPLPANARGIVQSFVETQAQLTALGANRPWAKDEAWYSRTAFAPGEGSADFGDVLFVVSRSDAYIWTLAAAFDSKGKLRGREAGYVYQRRVARMPSVAEPNKSKLIDAAPMARLLFATEPTPVTPEEMETLLEPERMDPLSICTKEAIAALAEGRQVVARLPDDLCEAARRSYKDGKIDLERFRQDSYRLGVTFKEVDGWFIVRPDRSTRCERLRIARPLLTSFMKRTKAMAELDVPSYSLFRYGAGGAIQGGVGSLYLRCLPNLGWPRLTRMDMVSGHLYAFLGSLSDSTWEKLIHGGSIDLGLLSAEQKGFIHQWFNESAPCLDREGGFDAPDQLLTGTEANPAGDLRGVRFWIEKRTVPAILPATKNDFFATWIPRRADSLGEELAGMIEGNVIQDTPDSPFRSAAAATNSVEWLYGAQSILTLKARPSPGVLATEDALDRSKFEPKPRTYENLPAEFREQVRKAMEKAQAGAR